VDNKSTHGTEREEGLLKVKERSGNVYENKGSIFHGPGQSGSVIDKR
jgi:hypothetical protein